MSVNYTILKSSLVYSSVWDKDAETCKVWVTMLSIRNKDGEIFSSMPGLAHASRISLEKTQKAVAEFLAPDPLSTTPDNEGRRIVEIQGGWRLLNHEKVKEEAAAANKAAYMQSYMAEKRAHEKRARSLGTTGEREYMVAVKRGAAEAELDAIVTKYLPQK
jgi:hypothetical protein